MLARQNVVSVFFSLFQYFKDHFGLAERALCAAELRYLSASGRFMHLWCVSCDKAALFGYFMLSPKGGYEHTEIDKKV